MCAFRIPHRQVEVWDSSCTVLVRFDSGDGRILEPFLVECVFSIQPFRCIERVVGPIISEREGGKENATTKSRSWSRLRMVVLVTRYVDREREMGKGERKEKKYIYNHPYLHSLDAHKTC